MGKQQQQQQMSREQVVRTANDISEATVLSVGTPLNGSPRVSQTPATVVGTQQQHSQILLAHSQSVHLPATGGSLGSPTLNNRNGPSPASQTRGCLERNVSPGPPPSCSLINSSAPPTPSSNFRQVPPTNPDSLISRPGLQSETDDATTGVPPPVSGISPGGLNIIRAGFRQQGGVRSCTPSATPVGLQSLAAVASSNANRSSGRSPPGGIHARNTASARCTSR